VSAFSSLALYLDIDTFWKVPKRIAKARKDGHVHAREEDEEMLLLDVLKPKASQSIIDSQTFSSSQIKPSPKSKSKPQPKPTVDSDTEPDEADADLILNQSSKPSQALPAISERSPSPTIDPGRAPGRIIGTTYPLADFQKNIAQGDVVTKAVEDFGWVIREIVMKPFSGRRTDELLECMKVLRETSLTVKSTFLAQVFHH
jgi:ATP-dependent DNA helicase 2 subunit 2